MLVIKNTEKLKKIQKIQIIMDKALNNGSLVHPSALHWQVDV